MGLPEVYQDATARNVTKLDTTRERIGVGLNLPNGEVIRLALPVADAQFVAECLRDSIVAAGHTFRASPEEDVPLAEFVGQPEA